jgi:hypothetical protein
MYYICLFGCDIALTPVPVNMDMDFLSIPTGGIFMVDFMMNLGGMDLQGGSMAVVGRPFGETCNGPADCESGLCFSTDTETEGLCTVACDPTNQCPDDEWACQQTTTLGEVCLPVEPKGPCEPCEANWECGLSDDYCVEFITEGMVNTYCTESCTGDSDCPAGYSCVDYLGEVDQCYPDNGQNQCTVFDEDDDGIPDSEDNCVSISNPDQVNSDDDQYGDDCDTCIFESNADQADTDEDGYGDTCDVCPDYSDPNQTDTDEDGYGDACDNCVNQSNPDQVDTDGNGIGDVCQAPVEIVFLMGSTLGGGGTSSSDNYTLVGGVGSHRNVLYNVNYRLTAYPEAQ